MRIDTHGLRGGEQFKHNISWRHIETIDKRYVGHHQTSKREHEHELNTHTQHILCVE